MKINTLIQMLENKISAIEAKKKIAKEKGNLDLLSVYDQEYIDTCETLNIVKKAHNKIEIAKEKLKLHLFENLPSLKFYFRKNSIKKAISDSLDKAFDKMREEIKIINGGENNG